MKKFVVAVAVAALAMAANAHILDQSQTDGSVYMAAFSQTDLAQSFMQTNNTIDGAAVLTQAGIGGGDIITISLWNLLPNAGGSMLATGSVSGVTPGQWAEVTWPAVNITPATTYYLVFTSDRNTMGLAGSVNNPYPNGQVYANAGFQPFPAFDYAFKTYYLPEPAALAMFAVAGLLIRRR